MRGIIQAEVRQMPLTEITTVAAERVEVRRDLLVAMPARSASAVDPNVALRSD